MHKDQTAFGPLQVVEGLTVHSAGWGVARVRRHTLTFEVAPSNVAPEQALLTDAGHGLTTVRVLQRGVWGT